MLIFFYYVFIHSDRSAWRCCDDNIQVNTQCKNTHAQLNVLICWLQITKLNRKKNESHECELNENCTHFSSYAVLCFTLIILIIFSQLTRCVLYSHETTQVYTQTKYIELHRTTSAEIGFLLWLFLLSGMNYMC